MPLRSARLTGDPVLTQCQEGAHRMFAGEDNLSVMRLQSALLDLGLSVGSHGADGIFGPDTGAAVTTFKNRHGLTPNDPVVGKGTAQALDDDLFRDPPALDPAFGEFSSAVVEHRLEQFVARELIVMLQTPFDSWRRMLATFALGALSSGQLLGIVAASRAADLRDPFLAVADPVQAGGVAAADFFADAITPINAHAVTIDFTAGAEHRSFITVNDEVILGRAVTFRRSDSTTAPETLLGVLVHELTHARNLESSAAIRTIPDDDTDVYADTALAAQRSATGVATGETAGQYVEEIVARHAHWVVLQELAGTPGGIAVRGLGADKLAAAALFYFVEETFLWDANQYGEGVNAQGDALRFPQLDKWLRLCAAQSFSDRSEDDQQSTLAFQAAAQFCADQVTNPTLDFAQEDGLFPLISDFR